MREGGLSPTRTLGLSLLVTQQVCPFYFIFSKGNPAAHWISSVGKPPQKKPNEGCLSFGWLAFARAHVGVSQHVLASLQTQPARGLKYKGGLEVDVLKKKPTLN